MPHCCYAADGHGHHADVCVLFRGVCFDPGGDSTQFAGHSDGFVFFRNVFAGSEFWPVITGLLSDHFARRAMQAAGAVELSEQFKAIGLHHAMYIIPTLGVALAVVLFAASRTVKKDIEKMQLN